MRALSAGMRELENLVGDGAWEAASAVAARQERQLRALLEQHGTQGLERRLEEVDATCERLLARLRRRQDEISEQINLLQRGRDRGARGGT